MQVITLLNEKGGVTKTTQACHLAAGLAIKGYRVLLVDTDPQGSASAQLKVKRSPKEGGGLYDLLVRESEWRSVLRVPSRELWGATSENGSLLILDSNIETRNIASSIDDVRLLSERLQELSRVIDVCIVDTAPTPSLLHAMIFLASDFLIYPTQAELMSLQGLANSLAHMNRMQKVRSAYDMPPIHLLGVQTSMYQTNTEAHQHGYQLIQSQFGDKAWQPITHRTVWKQASYAQKMMYAYAPEHEATQQVWEFVERVIEGVQNAS